MAGPVGFESSETFGAHGFFFLGGGGWWRWCGRGDALQVRCATALQTWCLWWRFGRLLPKPVGVTGTSTPSWRWWQSLGQTLPFFAPWGGPVRCRKHGPRAGSPAGWQTSPMNSAIPSEGPMRASWPRLRNRGYTNQNGSYRNSSELGGNEQLAAGSEGVQTLGAPGAEDCCQRHLAVGALLRTCPAADLAADYQMAQAGLGGVVVRRHCWLGQEDEESLDVALDASAQSARQRRWVIPEGLADVQQPPFQRQLGDTSLPWVGMGKGCGLGIAVVDCPSPAGQWGILWVDGLLVMDVPQQVGPAPLLGAVVMS